MNLSLKRTTTLLLAVFFCLAANGQTDDDFYAAGDMRRKFPGERYAASEVFEEYRFDKGKGLDGLPVATVEGNTRNVFVALKDPAYFQVYQFYNKFVSLKNFNYYYRNSKEQFKKASIKPQDKAATDDGIFLDDNRVKFYNVQLNEFGEAVKFEFNELYADSKYFTRIYFNAPYPIKDHQIRLVVPQWMEIEVKEMNFDGYKIQKTKTTDGKNNVFTYSLQNAEPFNSEPNALGLAYTFPHIIVSVKSWTDGTQAIKGFQSVDDIYSWYNYLYKKCQNDPETLKPVVTQVTAGKTTPEDKAKAIYYWLQDNIRYIAFEDGYAGFIPETAQDVMKNKYSDCKGMANLMTEMLKLAGLDAHLTWIGTKHIPYLHGDVNALCIDNHCISTLYIKGKAYFLDGTEKYIPFGENAYRIQSKSALIEKGASYDLLIVPPADKAANKQLTKATLYLNGNSLKGKVKVTMTGEERTDFHQYYQTIPSDRQKEFIKDYLSLGNDNLDVKNALTSALKNREIPVILDGDIDLSNQVTTVGKELFASIDFFPKTLQRFTPTPDRQNDFDFSSVYTYEDEIELSIPANMKFVDIPDPLKIETPDFAFTGAYSVTNNKIVLKKSMSIPTGRIRKKDFAAWGDFLTKLRSFNRNLISIAPK
ncbi:MAG: transglutaminase-like domain-containing protein [Chitinophagaceae bacterium]